MAAGALPRALHAAPRASRVKTIEYCFRGLTGKRMRRFAFRDLTQFLMAAEQRTCKSRTSFSRDGKNQCTITLTTALCAMPLAVPVTSTEYVPAGVSTTF
jgi:hypothetical protein